MIARKRGIALLITLWVLLILSVVALATAYGNRVELRLARFSRDQTRALAIAQAGIERAIAEMRLDDNTFDCMAEAWRRQYIDTDAAAEADRRSQPPLREIEFTDETGRVIGTYTLEIKDISSMFNINSEMSEGVKRDILIRLLEELEADEPDEIADCILDWLDPDDLHRLNGAETQYYQTLNPPYEAKNGPLDTIEEMLLIKGMDRALLFGYQARGQDEKSRKGLAELLTVYNDSGVNVNVAPAELLAAVLDADESVVDEILDIRDGPDGLMGTEDDRPFRSQRDLISVGALEQLYRTPSGRARFSLLTTRTSYFRLRCEAVLGDGAVRRAVEVVVDRGHVPVRTVFWRED